MSADRNNGTADGEAAETAAEATGTAAESAESAESEKPDEGLGSVGWLVVGVVFVAFLLVPGVIYLYPLAVGAFGLSFFATYLVLPLVPAIGLGLLGVWLLKRSDGDA